MRSVRIRFLPTEELNLPFAHSAILQGVLYKLLSADPVLSEEIHNKQNSSNRTYKFLCFSDIIGSYKICRKTLNYRGAFEWEIRSADDKIIDTVCQSVLTMPSIEINHYVCKIDSVETACKTLMNDEYVFHALTPIIVSDTLETGYTLYYNPFQPEFTEKITENLERKYHAFYGRPPASEISITVLAPDDRNKCVTRYKDTIINAWYGDYRIKADKDVMDLIYYTGLGRRNAAGFGTVSEI